jgi:hypothetical protein
MKKVKITIEVTDKGFSREVEYKGKTYKESSVKLPSFGAKELTPSIDSQKGLPKFIKDNLDDAYYLMNALSKHK